MQRPFRTLCTVAALAVLLAAPVSALPAPGWLVSPSTLWLQLTDWLTGVQGQDITKATTGIDPNGTPTTEEGYGADPYGAPGPDEPAGGN